MSAMPSALRDEALALPAEQRAELAAELLASLDDEISEEDPDEIDRAWGEEMLRRSAEVTSGEVRTRTWNEVRSKLVRALRRDDADQATT